VRISLDVALLLFVSLIAAPSFEKGKAADKESETIVRLEREWLSAFGRGDAATVDRMERATFTAVDGTGQVTKIEQLKLIGQRAKRDLGVTYAYQRQDVRLFGNVALLTGLCEVKIAANEPAEQALVTEIWVRQDGTWKIEHLQEGTLTRASDHAH
jgi:ketosteroid isomerase-like protein